MTVHYRACNLCEAICGLEIEVADNRIVSVRGDRDDPFSHGHVCPKAVALRDIQDDPDRLRHPVRRVGDRWEPIGWDDAYALVAERLALIHARDGADAIATYQGNPVVHNYGLLLGSGAFMGLLKTRNRFSATSVDQLPHQLVTFWMYGHQLLIPIPDIDRTRYFLVLGANPLVSNGSLMTVPDVTRRIAALRARGGRMVVIDPRRTETAAAADEHHFIRPGNDAAFLLGILHTLFAEGLADPGRLTPMLDGWDDVARMAAAYDADRVSPACGVPADDIRRIARDMAGAEAAVCYGRMGACTQQHGSLTQWLIQLVNIATGNLDRVGGALATRPAFDMVAASRPGSHGRWASRVSHRPEVHGELPASAMAEEMLTPGAGQVRALVTIAGNPVVSTPNGRKLDAALAGLEFMVSFDLYINETTRHADLILPSTTAMEREHYDAIFNIFAVRNVARQSPAVLAAPPGVPHDWEVLAQAARHLAAAMGVTARAAVSPELALDAGLRAGPWGLSLDALRHAPHGIDLGPLVPSFPERLMTHNHRIACAPAPLMAALADADRTLFGPATPHMLLIGRRHIRSNNSWMHRFPRLTRGKPRCQLLMNVADARARGLADGQRVTIRSRVGSIEAELESTGDMMAGVVSLPHGWGAASANDLTDDAFFDAVSGNAALNGLPVNVEAAA